MARFHGDLPARTYRFALAIMDLCERLPNVAAGWIIAKQLLRSGTSVGANVREADAALTEREFVQFCNIARREVLETNYWLCLCRDRQLLSGEGLHSALAESNELSRVLATVIRKMKAKQPS